MQFTIQREDGEFNLLGLERHIQESYFLLFAFLSYDKLCGELALGENCIEIISEKSNSLGMFLGIQSDIYKSIIGLTYQESPRCFPEFRDPAQAH